MGDAVPGRVVKSSFHLPSSSGDVVGACVAALALVINAESGRAPPGAQFMLQVTTL